jgi:HemY protein
VAPLIASDSPQGRPTRRVCLLMADIEEAESHLGAVREWLARAARAPRDKAWVADGVISDRWAPVAPSGTLDAFVWRTPDERLAPYIEPPPIEPDAPTAPPAIGAPTPSPAPQAVAAQVSAPAVESPRRASPAPPPRSGVIIDPTAMAPDDPGPGEPPVERSNFPLYASE